MYGLINNNERTNIHSYSTMSSFNENCVHQELCLCNIPIPALERQTNQVPREAYLDDGHELCDDEPCASCLDRWECDLDALKNLDEIDGLAAYHIANHEKMIEAGKRRQRKAAAFEAARAAFEAERAERVAEAWQAARQAYLAVSYDPVVDAVCFREFQAARAQAEEFPPIPPMPPMYERQTNDHPINFQAPQPRCLVKNCECEYTGVIAHLVKEIDGELVPM
jgi:hypothetical protein